MASKTGPTKKRKSSSGVPVIQPVIRRQTRATSRVINPAQISPQQDPRRQALVTQFMSNSRSEDTLSTLPPIKPLITVYFDRAWVMPLCDAIREAESIQACVYYFTYEPILLALQRKDASIIIQSPRPQTEEWKADRWRELGEFNPNKNTWQIGRKSYNPMCTNKVLRYREPEEKSTDPIMHHKFFVFSKRDGDVLKPYAVWTGSANVTEKAALKNDENVLLIRDADVACQYWSRWYMLFYKSKPIGCYDCGNPVSKKEHEYCLPCFRQRALPYRIV